MPPTGKRGATGVNGNQNDNSIPQSGAVYVFTRTGTWTQQAYIKASNTGKASEGTLVGDGDQFGFSLTLSGDGNTLAVGAISEDSAAQQINGNQGDDSAQSAGAVAHVHANGNHVAQQAYVKSANMGAGDGLGFSVALSFDGNTLAAAAFDEDGGGLGNQSSRQHRVTEFRRALCLHASGRNLEPTGASKAQRVKPATALVCDGHQRRREYHRGGFRR